MALKLLSGASLALLALPFPAHGHNHNIGKSGEMKLEDWTTKGLPGFMHPDGYWINRTSYKSPVIKLKTGEAHFTINQLTAIPFPSGDYTMVRVDWNLVDGQEKNVSLHEVYNHHWLIGAKNGVYPLAACEGDFFWGAGAEMRGMPMILPKGYGFRRVKAGNHCGGNLHFIRTEGLKTKWNGMNDPSQYPPDMQMGAAIKNCIECGYAPGRATGICWPFTDGGFECCFTESRCPTEGDRSAKSYHLSYEVQWTRNLSAVKAIQGGVIDVSDGMIEWNVGPKLTNRRANQICTETVCTISQTYTVRHLPQMGSNGMCPGNMLWAYMHQHNGAINGSMYVNGKHACTSFPRHGTDPNWTPGNELGYVVGFDLCIDNNVKGNAVRLEKGDRMRLEALYDVDVKSNVSYPMPGGKHGGIMALWFFAIDCDQGTYDQTWVCRDNQCLEAGMMSRKGDYKTLQSCSENCGAAVV